MSAADRPVESLGRETSPSLLRISRPGRGRFARLHLLLSAVLFFGGEGWAGVGTSAMQFVRMGGGARTAALGGARAAGHEAETVLWNPAGLARLGGPEATFTYERGPVDTNLQTAAAAWPRAGRRDALAVGVIHFGAGEIDGMDETGARRDAFTGSDFLASIGYARMQTREVAIGAAAEWVRSELAGVTGSGLAVSLGVQAARPRQGLVGGVAVRHLGPAVRFEREEDPLPMTIAAGGSWRPKIPVKGWRVPPIELLVEGAWSADLKMQAGAGLEVEPAPGLFARGGYRTGNHAGGGLSAGIGLRVKEWVLDYAYAPYGALGGTHLVTLTARLGRFGREGPQVTAGGPDDPVVQEAERVRKDAEAATVAAAVRASAPPAPVPVPAGLRREVIAFQPDGTEVPSEATAILKTLARQAATDGSVVVDVIGDSSPLSSPRTGSVASYLRDVGDVPAHRVRARPNPKAPFQPAPPDAVAVELRR